MSVLLTVSRVPARALYPAVEAGGLPSTSQSGYVVDSAGPAVYRSPLLVLGTVDAAGACVARDIDPRSSDQAGNRRVRPHPAGAPAGNRRPASGGDRPRPDHGAVRAPD